jgi:protease I
VTERVDPQRRDRVEIAAAVDVDQLATLGAIDDDRLVVRIARHLREAVPHHSRIPLDPGGHRGTEAIGVGSRNRRVDRASGAEEVPGMGNELRGRRIAFVVANEGAEQSELRVPWEAVERAGGMPVLVAPKPGAAQAFKHLDKGDAFPVDRTTSEIKPADFEAVVLPGGVANPDQLRMDEAAVRFVRSMVEGGKPVAVICHGPWTLVEADVVRGRTLTSWPSLKTDIRNAGGTWVDEPVVVCDAGPNRIVTSRKPDDLAAFCAKFVEVFANSARSAA